MTEETAGTPRVDAVCNWDTECTLVAELARQLEREVAALTTQRDGNELAYITVKQRLVDLGMIETQPGMWRNERAETLHRLADEYRGHWKTAEAQRDELQRVHEAVSGGRKWRLGKLTRFDDFGLAFIEADGQSYCFTFDKLQGYRGETPKEVGLIVGRLMPILTEDGKVLFVITDGSLKCPKDDCEVFATAFARCNRTDCPHGYATGTASTTALPTNETELRAELDAAKRALAERFVYKQCVKHKDYFWPLMEAKVEMPIREVCPNCEAALAAKSPLG